MKKSYFLAFLPPLDFFHHVPEGVRTPDFLTDMSFQCTCSKNKQKSIIQTASMKKNPPKFFCDLFCTGQYVINKLLYVSEKFKHMLV